MSENHCHLKSVHHTFVCFYFQLSHAHQTVTILSAQHHVLLLALTSSPYSAHYHPIAVLKAVNAMQASC